MTSVTDIEQAVARLAPEELAAFRSWFDAFEAERFDERIARDSVSGRLDRLAEEARDDHRRGDIREL